MTKNLKNQVLQILEKYPKARNSDQWLTIKIWCDFYPTRIIREEGKEPMIKLSDIMELPREDNVKRVRAIIQNEDNMFLPTSIEVVKQRKINEDIWRRYIISNKY